MHVTEKEMLFRAVTSKVPKFNREVFDSNQQNRQRIGTVNEIMGPFNKYVGGTKSRCFQWLQTPVSTRRSSQRNRRSSSTRTTSCRSRSSSQGQRELPEAVEEEEVASEADAEAATAVASEEAEAEEASEEETAEAEAAALAEAEVEDSAEAEVEDSEEEATNNY
jgi:Ca2+-dependent lipid-binding protein